MSGKTTIRSALESLGSKVIRGHSFQKQPASFWLHHLPDDYLDREAVVKCCELYRLNGDWFEHEFSWDPEPTWPAR